MTIKSNLDVDTTGFRRRQSRIGSNSPRDEDGRLIERLNDFSFHKFIENDAFVSSTAKLDPRHNDFTRFLNNSVSESGTTYYYHRDASYTSLGDWPSETEVAFNLRRRVATKDWNALIDLAEIQSTVNGLAKRATQIGDAYRALRRGDLGSFGKALDVSIPPSKRRRAGAVRANISGHLLEYQFAIVPIYQSMYDGAVTIYEARQRNPKYLVSTSLKNTFEVDKDLDLPFRHPGSKSNAWGFYRAKDALHVSGKKRVKMITEIGITNPDMAYLSEFGIANPLAAAYAVLPNSWLFDFFYPLGGFLEQLYMPPGITPGRTLVISAHSAEARSRAVYGEALFPYLGVNQYNQATSLTARMDVNAAPLNYKYVWISSRIIEFPGLSFPPLKLPFLGQAMTGLAYADQQSKKIKQVLTYKGIT